MNNDTLKLIELHRSLHKDHDEWQKHKETQLSTFTNLLLIPSGLLVILIQREPTLAEVSWIAPIGFFLLGWFGILTVIKYWERWNYHESICQAHLRRIDELLGTDEIAKTRAAARTEHEDDKHYGTILKDPVGKTFLGRALELLRVRIMQHWLWALFFATLILFGGFLAVYKTIYAAPQMVGIIEKARQLGIPSEFSVSTQTVTTNGFKTNQVLKVLINDSGVVIQGL